MVDLADPGIESFRNDVYHSRVRRDIKLHVGITRRNS
jgi:hypothetical protein